MQTADIHHLEVVLLFLAVLVVALAALARRFKTPYPIVLVIGGLAVSLLPNVPRIVLNPDIVFLVLLPPLLFAASFHMPWRSFRRTLTKSSMMAFGLVGFSVATIAYLTPHLLPGFDHRIGFVLGALVASTDAVAATAIAKRMRLPSRIADVLESESLLNDASSLLALEFSVALVVGDSVPKIGAGTLRLAFPLSAPSHFLEESFVGFLMSGLGVSSRLSWEVGVLAPKVASDPDSSSHR